MRALLALSLPMLALTACNQPPDAPQITLNPGEPTTTDDIAVMFLALTADGNAKDEVTHTFQWFQDGTFRPDLTTDTVPASETTKGETWKVVVVPNDGTLDGTAAEASATVVNTPPVATVSLAADPVTDADLVAEVTSEDADVDTVTYTYAWTRDGEAVPSTAGTIPASETAHGETWTVTVTPNDGEADGEPVTASVVVANSAPNVESVELAPSPAFEDSVLTATAIGVDDLDDDGVTLTYTWYVNETEVQSGEDDTLTGALFDKHDLVRVEVTPTDGFVDGATVASVDLLIENTVPTGTSVSIVSSSADGAAYEASTLTCTPAGWADADGDAEGWTYAWQVDGAEVSTAASLDGTLFSKGNVVACTATPTDGEASGPTLTSSAVSVGNTAPVLASATLSTTAPTESDTVSVTLGAASDDDGDTLSYSYAWYVDGTLVSTSETLLPSRFVKGDVIEVTVTPYDGTDLGTAVSSPSAIAANSAPTVAAITLSPSAVYTDDTLTASASTTDLDGDSVSLTYDWTVNGVPVGASGATLDGGIYFDRDDVVEVTVTPNDGTDSGSSLTSSSVTIRNTAPTAPVVAIDPTDPEAGDSLFCDVTTDATDADGDALTYTFAWEQDGAAFGSASTTVWTGDTVAGAYVQDDEEWTCSVTASDGTDSGSAGEDEVVVGSSCASVDFFDGEAYATNSSTTLFNFGPADSFTVAWWDYSPSGYSGHYFIKGTSVANKGTGDWAITRSGTGYLYFANQDRGSQVGFAQTQDEWVYRALSYSSGNVRYYENGTLIGTSTLAFSAASGKPLLVGGLPGYGAGESNAFMTDIAIWSGALAAADIASLASGGANPDDMTGLRAWWRMNEGSGSSVSDLSSNAADLTLSSSTAWSLTQCP